MQDYTYPNLWRGCEAAWCPSEDRSRSTRLTDFSGRGNHGDLTNMDPATDWVASGGKIALDFEKSNDHVLTGLTNIAVGINTISFWVNARAVNAGFFLSKRGTGGNQIQIWNSASNVISYWNGTTVIAFPGSPLVLNRFDHYCVVRNGTDVGLHKNGVLFSSVTSAIPSATTSVFKIGTDDFATYSDCQFDDIRVYNRATSVNEIATLSQRRGIAYETNRIRRYFLPAAGGFTIDADVGSFALTGTAADLVVARSIAADSGSFALSGTAVDLTATRTLSADAGSFALSGTDAGLLATRTLSADSGSFALAGTDASLDYTPLGAFSLEADPGSFALAGTNTSLLATRIIEASPGSLSLAGTDASLDYTPLGSFNLDAEPGSFALTGTDAGLLATRTIAADSGSLTLSGTDAGLIAARALVADSLSLSLGLTDAGLIVGRTLSALSASFLLSGTAATLVYTPTGAFDLVAESGSFLLTGQAATLVYSGAVQTGILGLRTSSGLLLLRI